MLFEHQKNPHCRKAMTIVNVGNYLGMNPTSLNISEVTLKCGECGKAFSFKYNIVDHYKIHTGERPYTCFKCEKGFMRKSHLVQQQKIHIEGFFTKRSNGCNQRIHTRPRPYKCSQCEEASTLEKDLE